MASLKIYTNCLRKLIYAQFKTRKDRISGQHHSSYHLFRVYPIKLSDIRVKLFCGCYRTVLQCRETHGKELVQMEQCYLPVRIGSLHV